jgi:CTP synthase
MSPDRSLVEFVELPRDVHPYYVGTQAHPEFRSRPHRAHPLFSGLVEAAVNRQRAERLVEVDAVAAVPGAPVEAGSAAATSATVTAIA